MEDGLDAAIPLSLEEHKVLQGRLPVSLGQLCWIYRYGHLPFVQLLHFLVDGFRTAGSEFLDAPIHGHLAGLREQVLMHQPTGLGLLAKVEDGGLLPGLRVNVEVVGALLALPAKPNATYMYDNVLYIKTVIRST